MKPVRSTSVFVWLLALALSACGTDVATNTGNPDTGGSAPDGIQLVRSKLERESKPAVPDADLSAFGDSSRDFALELYSQVRTTDGNLFLSPYSVATALGMLYAGAKGETKSEMMSALHFDLPEPELHAAFNATDLALSGRPNELAGDRGAGSGAPKSTGDGLQLNVVNGAFVRRGAKLYDPYLDVLAQNYDTGMFVADFAADPEASRKSINDWVLDQTHDRIDELLPMGSITPDVLLVLVNAIYFKASWLTPFDPAKTAAATFHGKGGDSEVQMMHGFAELYAEGDGWQALALPYISPDVKMLFVLPAAGRFDEIETGFDRAFVDQVRGGLGERLVSDAQVPRFRFESEAKLGPALQALGMKLAFVPGGADLSGIAEKPGDVWVDEVYHKAFVALDEQGTEAAAATAVVARDTSAPQPATFVLDRPFLFLIYDDPTGQILFVGRLTDPG